MQRLGPIVIFVPMSLLKMMLLSVTGLRLSKGVQLWDGLRIKDDVFVGPNAIFTNDIFPRSKKYPEKFLNTTIKGGASIGANATILAGLTIGQNALVGAGAVVISDVPSNAVVVGNPALILRYVDESTVS